MKTETFNKKPWAEMFNLCEVVRYMQYLSTRILIPVLITFYNNLKRICKHTISHVIYFNGV